MLSEAAALPTQPARDGAGGVRGTRPPRDEADGTAGREGATRGCSWVPGGQTCAHAQGGHGCCGDMRVLQGGTEEGICSGREKEEHRVLQREVRLRPSNGDETECQKEKQKH